MRKACDWSFAAGGRWVQAATQDRCHRRRHRLSGGCCAAAMTQPDRPSRTGGPALSRSRGGLGDSVDARVRGARTGHRDRPPFGCHGAPGPVTGTRMSGSGSARSVRSFRGRDVGGSPMSPAGGAVVARDRVLPGTRVLSIVIIPFLLVAFVLLYFWPSADDTARLFAWRIVPGFTSMVLGVGVSRRGVLLSPGRAGQPNGTRSGAASFRWGCSPR